MTADPVRAALAGLDSGWASGTLTADDAETVLAGLGYDRGTARNAVAAATPARGQNGTANLAHHAVIFDSGAYRIERLFTPDQLRGGALSVRVLVDVQTEATAAQHAAPGPEPSERWLAAILEQLGTVGRELLMPGVTDGLYAEVVRTAAALLSWAEDLRRTTGESS